MSREHAAADMDQLVSANVQSVAYLCKAHGAEAEKNETNAGQEHLPPAPIYRIALLHPICPLQPTTGTHDKFNP